MTRARLRSFGLTGVNLSFFLSPRGPVSRGLTVGLGPFIGFPATNSALGRGGSAPRRRSFGNRRGHGLRAFFTRHIWSMGGNVHEADINETYLQPFVSYTTQDA